MRVALITGVNGQDGSYLSEFLLEKGYIVWGMIRRTSSINTERINHLYEYDSKKFILRYGDLSDGTNILKILYEINVEYPDMERLEIYNLAAMSHVKISFEIPEYTGNVDGLGTLRILDAILNSGYMDKIRFYQASTSELYGKVAETPQNEETPFHPRSPYGVAKLYAYWIVKNYRESYGLYACNGILFNHESPRRGHNFVTRKVTRGLGMILRGEEDKLVMGNIDALRDWGHAKDFVRGMWMMLQQDAPDDFVLATGKMRSVRSFIVKAFKMKGFDIRWEGEGVDEIGVDHKSGKELITISDKYFRPAEVEKLLGNYTKAYKTLGWECEISFDKLVEEMVGEDC